MHRREKLRRLEKKAAVGISPQETSDQAITCDNQVKSEKFELAKIKQQHRQQAELTISATSQKSKRKQPTSSVTTISRQTTRAKSTIDNSINPYKKVYITRKTTTLNEKNQYTKSNYNSNLALLDNQELIEFENKHSNISLDNYSNTKSEHIQTNEKTNCNNENSQSSLLNDDHFENESEIDKFMEELSDCESKTIANMSTSLSNDNYLDNSDNEENPNENVDNLNRESQCNYINIIIIITSFD